MVGTFPGWKDPRCEEKCVGAFLSIPPPSQHPPCAHPCGMKPRGHPRARPFPVACQLGSSSPGKPRLSGTQGKEKRSRGAAGSRFHGMSHHGLRLPGTWGGATRKVTMPSHTQSPPGLPAAFPFLPRPPGAPHPSRHGEGSRAACLGTELGFAVPGRGP